MIRFLINNDVVELNEARADLTLLQFIREHRKKQAQKKAVQQETAVHVP